jgi:ATP-dependent Clp protease ATP-binding subunit ClpC
LRTGPGAATVALEERFEQLTRARDVAVDAEEYERAERLTRELDGVAAELATARSAAAVPGADPGRRGVGGVAGDRHPGGAGGRGRGDGPRAAAGAGGAAGAAGRGAGRGSGGRRRRGAAGRAGLASPNRPVGSLLFLGPTGVGKTELARALADALFGAEPVRFDMAEFADASSLTRLLGAPPGHVGHDEPGQLTEALRRDPYAVVLFDEVEKAHRDVTGALLALLDAGRLTDAHGRTVDATHAVVILTSNLGAPQILAAPAGTSRRYASPCWRWPARCCVPSW